MKPTTTEPVKQYELGGVKHTHDLVIKYNDRQIYRIRDRSHTLRSGTITIEQLSGNVVAGCRIAAFGRQRKLCLRDPNSKPEDIEWIDLESSGGGFSFTFNGKTCVWSRTNKYDYTLEDEGSGEVLMAFVDNSKNLDNLVPQLNFPAEMGNDLERLSLAALFSLAKRDKGSLSNMSRLAMGSAGAGIMLAGGGGGGG